MPPRPTHEHRHDGVSPHRDEELGAGLRHLLDEHRRAPWDGGLSPRRTPRGRALSSREVEGERAVGGLVAHVGRGELERHWAARARASATRRRPRRWRAGPRTTGHAAARAAAPSPRARRATRRRRPAHGWAAIARRRAASGGGAAERGGDRDAGPQAGDRRHARLAEPPRRRRRRAARAASPPTITGTGRDRRAGEDPLLDRRPALRDAPEMPGRTVVEHEHVADRRVLADGADEVAQRLDLAPDHRRVVERVGDRGGGGQLLAQRRDRGRRERRQRKTRRARPRRPRGRSRRPSR